MRKQPEFTVETAATVHPPGSETTTPNLASFRSNYRKNLPGKVGEIEALFDSSIQDRPEVLKRLYMKFYHLAGTSGSLGATSVSEEAGRLVALLQPLVDNDMALSPEQALHLEQGMHSLRKAAHEESESEEIITIPGPLATQDSTSHSYRSELFLVDADPEFSQYLTLYLEKLGHRVYAYRNTADLLTVVQGISPKAILIDLVFEEGANEGIEVIQKIQSSRSTPIPVIFLSYRDDAHARMMAAASKGAYFFKKPVDEERLLIALDRISFAGHLASCKVLVVTTKEHRGPALAEALSQSAFETYMLEDPLQTFAAIAHYMPDHIVLDTQDLDSTLLASAIKQHEAFSSIPVTAIAPHAQEGRYIEAIESGVDNLISRHLPPAHIARIIKARMHQHAHVQQSPMATQWTP